MKKFIVLIVGFLLIIACSKSSQEGGGTGGTPSPAIVGGEEGEIQTYFMKYVPATWTISYYSYLYDKSSDSWSVSYGITDPSDASNNINGSLSLSKSSAVSSTSLSEIDFFTAGDMQFKQYGYSASSISSKNVLKSVAPINTICEAQTAVEGDTYYLSWSGSTSSLEPNYSNCKEYLINVLDQREVSEFPFESVLESLREKILGIGSFSGCGLTTERRIFSSTPQEWLAMYFTGCGVENDTVTLVYYPSYANDKWYCCTSESIDGISPGTAIRDDGISTETILGYEVCNGGYDIPSKTLVGTFGSGVLELMVYGNSSGEIGNIAKSISLGSNVDMDAVQCTLRPI